VQVIIQTMDNILTNNVLFKEVLGQWKDQIAIIDGFVNIKKCYLFALHKRFT